jgi:hypothetical protein
MLVMVSAINHELPAEVVPEVSARRVACIREAVPRARTGRYSGLDEQWSISLASLQHELASPESWRASPNLGRRSSRSGRD